MNISEDFCYVDYAGAGLATKKQLKMLSERLLDGTKRLANPHSGPVSSLARRANDELESAREMILKHCGVSGETHSVIFTASATAACKLVGDNFPWTPRGSQFVYSQVNHTSVVGIRELAILHGASVKVLRDKSLWLDSTRWRPDWYQDENFCASLTTGSDDSVVDNKHSKSLLAFPYQARDL
jgi:selenocysteine lyase/cysteine desulfurase